MTHKIPWQPTHNNPFEKAGKDEAIRFEGWLLSLKKIARENVNDGNEQLRISWQNRWKRPRYDSFDDYTQEEAIVEMWEQHYYENPDSLEMQGIHKKRNFDTGYAYYETGDPVLDDLEREFGKGNTPDLQSAFADIGVGRDIFRSEVFMDQNGSMRAPFKGLSGTIEALDGTHRTVSGAIVQHDDYNNDDWIDSDPVLKSLKEKLGG